MSVEDFDGVLEREAIPKRCEIKLGFQRLSYLRFRYSATMAALVDLCLHLRLRLLEVKPGYPGVHTPTLKLANSSFYGQESWLALCKLGFKVEENLFFGVVSHLLETWRVLKSGPGYLCSSCREAETFLMADIFDGFSYIRFAGYLELRGGTSIYTGYLKSCRAPRIMQGTSDCAEIIPLADTWRSIGVDLVHFPAWISAAAVAVLGSRSGRFKAIFRWLTARSRSGDTHGKPPSLSLHFISLSLSSFSFSSLIFFFLVSAGVFLGDFWRRFGVAAVMAAGSSWWIQLLGFSLLFSVFFLGRRPPLVVSGILLVIFGIDSRWLQP
ncbi:hypothetical protein WN943_019179 [Citrus x changshan-huyou]